jgi:predicted alpha/beta-hydrolase family hydrolase
MKEVTFAHGLNGIVSGEAKRGLVLISHSAGGNMRTPLIAHTAERLSERGFLTLRWNFRYIDKGGAPSFGGKNELPEMAAALECLKQHAGTKNVPIILIGKSFGARVATHFAPGQTGLAGFVFYGLPLQGMSKTSKPRDWSHLSQLTGRVLFITGEKDRLCPLEQLAEAQKFMRTPFESTIVPGDHSFKPKGEASALESCIDWMDKSFV